MSISRFPCVHDCDDFTMSTTVSIVEVTAVLAGGLNLDTNLDDINNDTVNTTLDQVKDGLLNSTAYNQASTTSANDVLGIDAITSEHILNGFIVLSALTIVVNMVVLVMSKFANGGKSSTFVFLRSLCMADMLIGMFGVFKCILLNNLRYRLINCFLPESLFISASTVICVTLFWFNIDSYFRLSQPLGKINTMDKHCVIISMVFLWNVAFIIGFVPLMGWNDEEFVCNVFQFYKFSYTMFVSLIWLVCIVGSCVTHFLLNRTTRQIRANSQFISPRSLEFLKYSQVMLTIRNDMITLVLCYLPFLAYLSYYYTNHRHRDSTTANVNIIYFLPIFLARSLVSAFIHSYRTIRIQHVLHDITKHVNVTLFGKWRNENRNNSSNRQNLNTISNCNSIATLHTSATATTLEGAAGASDNEPINRHKKLCATDSAVTIIDDESDLEFNPNTINLTKL